MRQSTIRITYPVKTLNGPSASTTATPDVLNRTVKKAFEMAYDIAGSLLEELSAQYDQPPNSHSLVVGEGSYNRERDVAWTDRGKDRVP